MEKCLTEALQFLNLPARGGDFSHGSVLSPDIVKKLRNRTEAFPSSPYCPFPVSLSQHLCSQRTPGLSPEAHVVKTYLIQQREISQTSPGTLPSTLQFSPSPLSLSMSSCSKWWYKLQWMLYQNSDLRFYSVPTERETHVEHIKL